MSIRRVRALHRSRIDGHQSVGDQRRAEARPCGKVPEQLAGYRQFFSRAVPVPSRLLVIIALGAVIRAALWLWRCSCTGVCRKVPAARGRLSSLLAEQACGL